MDIVQSSHYSVVSRISDSYQDKGGVHFVSAFFPTSAFSHNLSWWLLLSHSVNITYLLYRLRA